MAAAEGVTKRNSWRFLLPTLFGAIILLAGGSAEATEYYVAPTGADSNAGTMAQPFATIQRGHDAATAGDTVWIRGGTYKITNGSSGFSGILISKSGRSDTERIKFWAMPGEVPVVDFSGWRSSSSDKANGIYVTGNWVHIKGLEIANLPQAGSYTNSGLLSEGASNNIFELLNIHHIGGPGLFIHSGNGGNLILNCDAHDNYDSKSSQGAGENADGFGVHYQSSGPSTVIRGCRAWWNSDDGYDLISQEVPVSIEDSWAIANGYINSGASAKGNGNGFKAGSSKNGIRHTIKNCVAWQNYKAGFYANHSSCGNNWYNNTSYNNGTAYDMMASTWDSSGNRTDGVTLTGAKAHKMRNNIGFPNKNAYMQGVDTASNTWDLNIVPATSDFVSTTETGGMGPRQAGGGLPVLTFMKLSAGSKLIDKGADVGLPFTGAAPDLGAYEYGTATPSGGTGGSGNGNAGASGSGGAAGSGGNSAAGTGGNAGQGTGGNATVIVTGGSSGTGTGGGAVGVATGGAAGAESPATGTGGSVTTSGSGGKGGTMATDPNSPSGCACEVTTISSGGYAASSLSALGFLALALYRRRRH